MIYPHPRSLLRNAHTQGSAVVVLFVADFVDTVVGFVDAVVVDAVVVVILFGKGFFSVKFARQ